MKTSSVVIIFGLLVLGLIYFYLPANPENKVILRPTEVRSVSIVKPLNRKTSQIKIPKMQNEETVQEKLQSYSSKIPTFAEYQTAAKNDVHGNAYRPTELILATSGLMKASRADLEVAREFSVQLENCVLGKPSPASSIQSYCLENLKKLALEQPDEAISLTLERVLDKAPPQLLRVSKAADLL